MCGILGIYRKSGLTADDIEKFKNMLDRCETRGMQATGVFNSRSQFFKAPFPASKFIYLQKADELLTSSVGCKYIIGHCRLATRGDPKIDTNNHPVYSWDRKCFLVHNGMVTCKKYDYYPEFTDTWILMNAIEHFRNQKKNAGLAYADIVKMAFNDITRNGYNSSAVITADGNQIVFIKSDTNPIAMQFIGDAAFFASTKEIIGLQSTAVDEKTGIEDRKWYELCKHSACVIDVETGKSTTELLETYPKPVPMVYHVDKFDPNAKPVYSRGMSLQDIMTDYQCTGFYDSDRTVRKDKKASLDVDCTSCTYCGEFKINDDNAVDGDEEDLCFCDLYEKEVYITDASDCNLFHPETASNWRDYVNG